MPPTMSIREVRSGFPRRFRCSSDTVSPTAAARKGPRSRWPGSRSCIGCRSMIFFATSARPPLRDAAAAPQASAPPPEVKPFSPHFILGSLFLTLTLGATTGMINLLRIAAGGDVPISHRQIHGHTQVLGFAVLFLMGIAFHALPRILGHRRRATRAGAARVLAAVLRRDPAQHRPAVGLLRGGARCCRFLSAASRSRRRASLRAIRVRICSAGSREGKYDLQDPILRFLRAGTLYLPRRHRVCRARRASGSPAHAETALPVSLDRAVLLRCALRLSARLDLRLRQPRRVAVPRRRPGDQENARDRAALQAPACRSSSFPIPAASRGPRRFCLRDAGSRWRLSPRSSISRATASCGPERVSDDARPRLSHGRDPLRVRRPRSLGGTRARGRRRSRARRESRLRISGGPTPRATSSRSAS